MKQTLCSVIIGLFIIPFLYSCSNSQSADEAQNKSPQKASDTIQNVNGCPNSSIINPTATPIPAMYVPKETGTNYEKNFLSLQYFQLTALYSNFKEVDSIFYPKKSFDSLVNYLSKLADSISIRVYIASYGTDTYCVPDGFKNKLTLVFVPVNKNKKELGKFAITPSGLFDPSSDSCNLNIGRWKILPNKWHENYLNKEGKTLRNNLDPDDMNNHSSSTSQDYSETQFITYWYPSFQQLDSELQHQIDTNKIHVSGVRAFFSSFGSSGVSSKNYYKNRIFVQFELTENGSGTDKVFYIEDQPDFCHRPTSDEITPLLSYTKEFRANLRWAFTFDTGNLCPPLCQ